MKFDKKVITVFTIVSVVAAGTALASWRYATSSETITLSAGPDVTASVTTTTAYASPGAGAKTVTVESNSPEAALANIIFRILDIPITVQEVTTLHARNMGYGEITLAYNLAHASGHSVNDILAMRFEQKMGWGKIAKTLGVKLHDANEKSSLILREANLGSSVDELGLIIKVDLDEENSGKAHDNDFKNNSHGNSQKHDNAPGNGNGHGKPPKGKPDKD